MKPTSLSASLLAMGAVIAAQPAVAEEGDEGAAIVVTALRDSSASITGTGTDLQRYPQSVRVIDEAALDRIGATRLDNVIDLAGGVARQNDFGGLWDKYSIRGFAGDENSGPDILINRFGSNLGFNAPIDTATVERFEFLRGAAAALSGRGEPGGSLNIVTKVPRHETHGSASLSVGRWDAVRLVGDAGGPLSDTLAVRLIGVVEDKGSFRDKVHANRELIAPSISFTPSDSLRFLYQAEYMRNRVPLDRGIVAISGDARAMDRSTFLGEPADGRMDQRIFWQQGSMFAALSDMVSLELGFSHRDGGLEGFATMLDFGPRGLQADLRTAGRQRRYHNFDWQDLSLRAELTARVDFLGLEHDLRLGVDRVRHGMDAEMRRARGTPSAPILLIDLFDPVYGQPLPEPGAFTDRFVSFRSESVYVQDVITAGDFTLLVGARWNSFRETLTNHLAGDSRIQTVDKGITPRAALTWALSPSFSLYTSWGESLRLNPSDGTSRFDGEKSDSAEIGAKYSLLGGAITGQSALFTMTKRNVLNPNAVDPFLKSQIGRQRSRGFETELTANLSGGLFVTAVYSYIDATVRRDQNAALIGTRLSNVPRHLGSIYANQKLGRFAIGAGVSHVGERVGDPFGTGYRLPGYTIARADVRYELNDQFSVRFNLDNIFDKYSIANSYANVWTTPGAPRNWRLTLSGRF
ncbi:TonB-dependent receptor [Novosphingobium endophyticum]|uniref:TonB-dependent receptor n=1 Tax=Novosphingobium endophyticum TaxID=1955250 RepID=A0A916X4Z0_9SPHN|nr:TonB-dependent receptor [Novosphingobium endophyticum]